MWNMFGAVEKKMAFAIGGGLVLLAGAGPIAATWSSGHLLSEEAKFSAHQWANYLGNTIPKLDQVLKTSKIEPYSLHMLAAAPGTSGGVFRSKLFDSEGMLIIDTSWPHIAQHARNDHEDYDEHGDRSIKPGPTLQETSPAVEDSRALEVYRSNDSQVFVKTGDGKSWPLHYSIAYVPLEMNDNAFGVIEVHVDQTARHSSILASLWLVIASMFCVALLAFLLPTVPLFHILRRQHQKTAEQLDHVTHHDLLTGIVNRQIFKETVDERLQDNEALAVYFVDLDKFKNINDLRGHETGDLLLKAVSERLKNIAGDNGFVGRYGGDEFVVCKLLDRKFVPQDVADQIVANMTRPFQLGDHDVQIGASVGYAISGKHGALAADLIKASDVAMYKAKNDGRGRSIAYEPKLESVRHERLMIEESLRKALQEKRFEIHYQPLFKSSGKKLCGFEALLRLNNDAGELITPNKFIPVAEEMGLMSEIGAWVIRDSCHTVAQWPEHLSISVNLSVKQFSSGNLVNKIAEVLKSSGLTPSRLQLEVTESVLIVDGESVLDQLNQLHDLGVTLALDDFGTGYSSLNYIWKYPFANIKIDRSFINGLSSKNHKVLKVLKSIVSLGSNLGVSVTAEGVETREQMRHLNALNCNYLQGFFLGEPLAVDDMPGFVAKVSAKELDDKRSNTGGKNDRASKAA